MNGFFAQIPAWVFPFLLPQLRRRWSQKVELTSIKVDEATAYEMMRNSKGRPLDLFLPIDEFLVREVSLSRKIGRHVEASLSLDLARAFPGHVDWFEWKSTKIRRDGPTNVFGQVVFRKEDMANLVERFDRAGARVRSVSTSLEGRSLRLVDHRSRTDASIFRWWLLGCFFVTLGFAALTGVELGERLRLQNTVGEISRGNEALRQRLVDMREENETKAEGAQSLEALAARFNANAQVLEKLAWLSEALDDTTWLSEFELSDGVIRISGQTGEEVPSLLDAIRLSDLAARVELDRPVALDRMSGSSRFSASIFLEGLE